MTDSGGWTCGFAKDRIQASVDQMLEGVYKRTDRLLVGLLAFQWFAAMALAIWVSPLTWAGDLSQTHPHVWTAVFLGGAIISLPCLLGLTQAGRPLTRHVIAAAQMLSGALLIHLTGGRIETHFHVFGSLAFLSFYRDWRVLITGSAVVALDHLLRGFIWPESVYGTAVGAEWRWLEHAGWVGFIDFFLITAGLASRRDMATIAARQIKLGMAKDTTEQRVLDRTAELRASEAQTRAALKAVECQKKELEIVHDENHRLLASIPSILISLDNAWKITKWNKAAQEAFDIPTDQAVGQTLADLPVHWDLLQLARCIGDCQATAQPTRLEDFPFKSLAGRAGFLGITVTPVKDGGGQLRGVLLLIADITERRRLELQLAQSQKLESIGQLAAGIAHEINTPIQFLNDNLAFLRDAFKDRQTVVDATDRLHQAAKQGTVTPEVIDALDEAMATADMAYLNAEIPKAIEQSLDGVQRVATIVRAMKEFSHPNAVEKAVIDINKAIENTIVVARNEWKYVAEMETQLDPALPPVPCLPGEFNQVILNLIVNAAHAIADNQWSAAMSKGTITISTQRLDEHVEIRVRDTGTGIPETIRAKIFDPFFTTKPVGKGTGQGLAITHTVITKKHGGTVTFETEMGKGTTFIIRLPTAMGKAS